MRPPFYFFFYFLLILFNNTILPAQTPFITEWRTDDGEITIPTFGAGYNYDITWTNLTTADEGDGSATAVTEDYTITGLTNDDIYKVEIIGDFPRIYFNNSGDKDKIQEVTQWGDIQWKNMVNAFWGCSNLDVIAEDSPDLLRCEAREMGNDQAIKYINIVNETSQSYPTGSQSCLE